MQITFNCKICGAPLNVVDSRRICQCEYCDTKQTIPLLDSDKKKALFSRANKLRLENEFDKASNIYENIISEFPTESEAYWGLILCKYGIEYVDDPSSGKKVPTCHRTVPSSIFEEKDFQNVLSYAEQDAEELYKSEARQIDLIQNSILTIAKNEKPYDVFICYKETDENGNRTKDSVFAQDIYDKLVEKGFKTFFARITLEDKLGKEYEPYIYSALNTAKVMLVIGTKANYLDSVWVKNEWSRFISFMKNDKTKTIIPCYSNMNPYDLPVEFRNFQGVDLSKIGATQDIIRGIEKLISEKKDLSNEDIEKIVNQTAKEQKKNNKKILVFILFVIAILGVGLYFYISNSNKELENIMNSINTGESNLTPASEVDLDTINVNINYIDDYPVIYYPSGINQAEISVNNISHSFTGTRKNGDEVSAEYSFVLDYDVLEIAKDSNNNPYTNNVSLYIQIFEDDSLLKELFVYVPNTKGKGQAKFNHAFILKQSERNITIKIKPTEKKEEIKNTFYVDDFVVNKRSFSSTSGELSLNVSNKSNNNLYCLCLKIFVYDENDNVIGKESGGSYNIGLGSTPIQPNDSKYYKLDLLSLKNDNDDYIFNNYDINKAKIIFRFTGYSIDGQNIIELTNGIDARIN